MARLAIIYIMISLAGVRVRAQCVPSGVVGCRRTSNLASQKCCTNTPTYCNLANTCIPCKQVNEVNCVNTSATAQACCPGLVCSSGVCVMPNGTQLLTPVVTTPLPTASTPPQTTINTVCVPEKAVGCRRITNIALQKCCTNKPLYCNLANTCIGCKQLNETGCVNTSATALACCPGLVCSAGICQLPGTTQFLATTMNTTPSATTTVTATTLTSTQAFGVNDANSFTTSSAETSTSNDTTPFATSSAEISTSNDTAQLPINTTFMNTTPSATTTVTATTLTSAQAFGATMQIH